MGVCDSVTNPSFGRWPCEAGGCRSSLSEDEEEEKVHAEIEKANGYKKCQDIIRPVSEPGSSLIESAKSIFLFSQILGFKPFYATVDTEEPR
ncbi:hypothetical protein PoB_001773500 [Plakobranchus ocellatus]|uniref:Uncharacterized protein n=1 Tax=Plakobranchus ocellatus TaxID=259542 RepID=A0AAV3Z7U9_9GAST|nr:hypothetical protein PoB_001773500 [Plakobranchus ocellatus]